MRGACPSEGTGAILETDFGNIVITFIPQVAPCHVANFITLANEGFYDGTAFHRVIPGFMVQGGDPNTKDEDRSNDGIGGPGYVINAEFSAISHRRGIVSMARGDAPNSAGSQFFIVVSDALFLDGQYSVFAEVVEGMDIVDRMVGVEKDSNDNPLERIGLIRITIIGA
ncbi:MAG: peptidylprolyl isomerase [Nitrososphaerales archaeon]|nr:peptidylprolyl isomerase [Nitrososphaerota archaeon]